jgi:hypothetical protein
MVQRLPSKCEALSSNPVVQRKQNKAKKLIKRAKLKVHDSILRQCKGSTPVSAALEKEWVQWNRTGNLLGP